MFNHMLMPSAINCDNEFNTHSFAEYARKNNIKLYFSEPNDLNKNDIVERVNRTIAQFLQKWRTATNQRAWYKVLPDIVENYNNTFRPTTKAKPSDVSRGHQSTRRSFRGAKAKGGRQSQSDVTEKSIPKRWRAKIFKEVYEIVDRIGHRFKVQNIASGVKPRELLKEYELQKIS